MPEPIPYKITLGGGVNDAPEGAIPAKLYGIPSGVGGGVTSVNGETGDVQVTPGSIGATTPEDLAAAIADFVPPVGSVNGQTGDVIITPATIGAAVQADISQAVEGLSIPVQSVNGEIGDVVLSASDVGAATPAEVSAAVTAGVAGVVIPVRSVNTKTGNVVLSASDVGAATPAEVSAAVTAGVAGVVIPVRSVNTKTGNVVLSAADVGATTPSDVATAVASGVAGIVIPVSSVNTKTGNVVLSAADVGAVPRVSTVNRLYGTDASGSQVTYPYTTPKNYAGQVRVAYTGLSLTGFTSNVNRDFVIASATPTVSASPTTLWPFSSGTNYNPDFYNSTSNRLRENNQQGQQHEWRVIGSYSNKATNNTGAIFIELYNPDSTFVVTATVALPSGVTSGVFTVTLTSIPDSASLSAGRGYLLRARTSFNDSNLVCDISSILRLSRAIENVSV